MDTNSGPHPGFGLPTVPSAARLYDYYLGGKNNYSVDRDLGKQIEAQVPEIKPMAQANRRFLARAVEHMAAQGIDQFLDIGSGLPAQDPVHEVARRRHPGARVLYVDHDPTVRVHAQALLADHPDITGVVEADMREPETIFAHPEASRLDRRRPVGLLLVAMLHFLRDDEDPAGLLQRYLDHLPVGSYVAISHVESDTAPDRAAALDASTNPPPRRCAPAPAPRSDASSTGWTWSIRPGWTTSATGAALSLPWPARSPRSPLSRRGGWAASPA